MSTKTTKFKDYSIKTIHSLELLPEIEQEWQSILKFSTSTNIYTNPHYFNTQFITRSPNSDPYVVVMYNELTPAALIIGKTIKRKMPLKIGYVKANSVLLDFLEIEIDGIITNNESQTNRDVYSFLFSLLEKNKFEVIEFQHFSERNQIWNHLNHSQGNSYIIKSHGKEYLCRIRDPKTGEQYVHHKAKTLRNFRRSDKIIRNGLSQLKIKEYTQTDQINEFLSTAELICKNSYHCELGVGVENNDYWKTNIKNMMHGNYFLGFILFSGDKPIAYNFGQLYKNYFYGFYMSFDLNYRKLQPGTYLLRRIIEKLVELKIDYYHLGYGEAEYKRLYSNLSYNEASFKVFSNSFRVKMIYFLIVISNKINTTLTDFLEKAGLYNKIKKVWRSKILSKN